MPEFQRTPVAVARVRPRRSRTSASGLLALVLLAAAARGWAQTSPITAQNLFFDQAGAHRGANGNYLEADAGAVYTDNIELTPNGSGGTIGLLGLLGDVGHQGARLDYRLDSDLTLLKYFGNQFPTEPYGFAVASADYRIVPGLFTWTAQDTYSEYTINPNEPATPGNTQALNTFTTGPQFTLRPTLRTTVTIGGFYGIVDGSSQSADYVDVNNRFYGGTLTFNRAFSPSLSGYLTGTWQKVEYANSLQNTDYRGGASYLGLRFSNARTALDVAAGYQQLHTTSLETFDSVIGTIQRPLEQTPSGSTWRFDLSRLIRPTQRVALHGLRQYSDASNLFQLGLTPTVPSPTGNQIVSGQPFTYTTYGVSWRAEYPRTTFEIDFSYNRQDYLTTPSLDTHNKIAGAVMVRKLSPVLDLNLGVYYERNEYALNSYNTFNGVASLRWRIGRRLGLRFLYARATLSPGYTENQFGIVGFYTLTPPATGTAAEPPALQPVAPWSAQQPLPTAQPVLSPESPVSP